MAKVGAQGLWVTGAPQKAQPGAATCSIVLPSGMWPAWHELGSCTQGHPKKWVPTPGRGGMPDLGVGKRERWSCRSNHEHPQLRKQPDEDVTYLGPLQDPVRSFFPAQRQG